MNTTMRTPSFTTTGPSVAAAVQDAEQWAARVAKVTAADFEALILPTDHSMA